MFHIQYTINVPVPADNAYIVNEITGSGVSILNWSALIEYLVDVYKLNTLNSIFEMCYVKPPAPALPQDLFNVEDPVVDNTITIAVKELADDCYNKYTLLTASDATLPAEYLGKLCYASIRVVRLPIKIAYGKAAANASLCDCKIVTKE